MPCVVGTQDEPFSRASRRETGRAAGNTTSVLFSDAESFRWHGDFIELTLILIIPGKEA